MAHHLPARCVFGTLDKDSSANIRVIAIDTSKEVISADSSKPGAAADHTAGQERPSTNHAVQPPNLGAPAPPTAQDTSSELQVQPHDPAMTTAQGEARHNLGKLYSCCMQAY